VNILVTGSGSLLGQGIIKSLKSSNLDFELYSTDYFSSAVGLYWANKSFLMPDILKDSVSEDSWLEALKEIIISHEIEIVIPGLDFEIPILAKHKDAIEKDTGSFVIVSPEKVVTIGNDKWETYKFLKESGLIFPESSLPEDREDFLSDNNYPLIVKPRFGHTSKDVFIVNNIEELKRALDKVDRPIIQEYLGSADEEYTCSTVFVEESIISTISLKRTLKNGNTHVAFLEEYEEIDDYINEVTKVLRPHGATNFQLRLTEKGPVIFEINPRFSGTTPIRSIFGVNEVEASIQAILFENYNQEFIKKPGVVIRYMESEFVEWKKYNSFKN
jgi:carbamoyl-phosphate synthase large subunit